MNASQIEQLHVAVRRFLAEYQSTFVTNYYGMPNHVDQRFVVKFINAVQELDEREKAQQLGSTKGSKAFRSSEGKGRLWSEYASQLGADRKSQKPGDVVSQNTVNFASTGGYGAADSSL